MCATVTMQLWFDFSRRLLRSDGGVAGGGSSQAAVVSVMKTRMPGERTHVLIEQLIRFSRYDESRPACGYAVVTRRLYGAWRLHLDGGEHEGLERARRLHGGYTAVTLTAESMR